jgi:SAM-dependent methyltransferase
MYEGLASTYDLFDDLSLDRAVSFILSHAFGTTEHILDFGAGTGRLAMELLRNDTSIRIDCYEPSMAMRDVIYSQLRFFRSALPRLRIFSNPARLADSTAGLVYSVDVLFLLDSSKLESALALIRRVLTPQGRLIGNFLNRNCTRPNRRCFEKIVVIGGAEWRRCTCVEKLSDRELKVSWKLDLGDANEAASESYQLHLHSQPEFESILNRAGFSVVACFADYDRNEFRPSESDEGVVIATKI